MTVKRRSSFRRTCNRRLILNFPCAAKLIRNLTFNARFSSARYIDRPMSLLFVVHAFNVCLFFKENSRSNVRVVKYQDISRRLWDVGKTIPSRLINLSERSIAPVENLGGRKFRRCAELFPGLRWRYFHPRNYLADYSRGCNVIQLVQESPVVWVGNWR